jgi:predicted ATPase
VLKQELGVEPSPETVALYERIRDGEVGERQVAATPPVTPSGLLHPSSLPVWLTPFVGRKDLLAEIHDRLMDPTCRLLTLVGPGGSGKTRLAVEAAIRLNVPHGVLYSGLQSADHCPGWLP